MKQRAILVVAWLGVVLYAFPGYMSFDSITQLVQARTGNFGLGHPPLMGVLWAICDAIITGPFLMLAIQVTCFVAGVFLLLRLAMSERAAAWYTLAFAWFPPVMAVMAVIWKDSQMTGFLVLGIALLVSDRRGVRIGGLALLSLATAMRYNALAVTFAPVVLLFVWTPAHRWYKRYPVAIAAWLVITVVPAIVNDALVRERTYLWHESLALGDITGTLRYAPDLPDVEVQAALAGMPLRVTTDIQKAARASFPPDTHASSFGTGTYVPALWATTFHLFDPPTTAEQRAAVTRAWRTIVLGHPGAYLAYRWHVLRERIHFFDGKIPSGVYASFTDSQDRAGSAARIGHNAASSHLQRWLHQAMAVLASSWLFRPWLYLVLSLLALPLIRDRRVLALALSGIANEAALYFLAPTIDFRYSIWLVVTTLLVMASLVAGRSGRTSTPRTAPLADPH